MSASLLIVLTGGLLDEGNNLIKHHLRKSISERSQNIEYINTLAVRVRTFLDPRFKVCVLKNRDTAES
jgi:hypothetical protein